MLDNVNQYNDEDKIEIFFSKKEDMILQHTFALKFDSEMMILNINSQKYLPVSRLEEKYIMSGFNTQIDYWEKLDTEEKSYFEMLNGRGIIFLEKKGGQSI